MENGEEDNISGELEMRYEEDGERGSRVLAEGRKEGG